MTEPASLSKAWRYFSRSLRLKCPVCGNSPLFRPIGQKGIVGWFETLPGCDHCDYAYDQEPGYFMLALWSFDYTFAAIFSIAFYFSMSSLFPNLSNLQILFITLGATWIFAMLIVRHAKAFYLAIDHYFFHEKRR